MGNPQAMDFLADKLNVGPANEGAGYWANIPVAIKMMECAFSQGNGPVAYNLSYMYASPRTATGRVSGPRTPETKALALKVLHEGVALGCGKCANKLEIEFGDPFDLANMLVPYIDKARAERYGVLNRELGFNPNAAFLIWTKSCHCHPPICRPGMATTETLLHAAMGVRPPPAIPQPSAASLLQKPYFLAADYALRPTGLHSDAPTAPFSAYWQPAQWAGLDGAGPAVSQRRRIPPFQRARCRWQESLWPRDVGAVPDDTA